MKTVNLISGRGTTERMVERLKALGWSPENKVVITAVYKKPKTYLNQFVFYCGQHFSLTLDILRGMSIGDLETLDRMVVQSAIGKELNQTMPVQHFFDKVATSLSGVDRYNVLDPDPEIFFWQDHDFYRFLEERRDLLREGRLAEVLNGLGA